MNEQAFFDMKGVVHEGGFGADWAVRNGWAVFWKFPYDALSSPLTGVPLPVGEYEMHADAWATGGEELGGGLATKLRVDAAAAGVPAVHCLRMGELRIAAISSMGIFDNFWKATADEKRRANALCTGLLGLGVDAFPCHGQHHLIVFRHWRPPSGGARVHMTPPRFSALLQRDPRVLELLATAFLPPPPRAADWKAWEGAKWLAHHCAVFPWLKPGRVAMRDAMILRQAAAGTGAGPRANPTPNRPNPTPNRPNPTPIRPNPTPNRPNPAPDSPNPTPYRPNPTPNRPDPTPNRPNPTSYRPNPARNRPNPTPDRHNPTLDRPNPTPNRPNPTYSS